ncbi:MAG: DUF47 domain-containing protein [Chloroflexi bacterium]|nr:MAG: DUF47 domain-containing protein [Chloroflexota bacterium]
MWEVLARFASRDECPRPDDRPCHELGPPGLAALEGLAVTTVVRTDREEADDDHPECDTRHESDREEHHRVSSFLRPKATRLPPPLSPDRSGRICPAVQGGDTVRLSLLPKKSEFFVLFEQHAQNAVEAAEALAKLLGDFTDVENKVRDIHAIEHHGDKLNHEIVRHLNETFVTPLDREDIVGLASRIDDITDVCYDVSELVQLFKVTSIRPPAVRQAKVLVTAATEVLAMLKNLEGLRNLEPHWIKIHTLENEGDQVWRDAVAELFAGSDDAIEIVKWKDIYSLVETAIDRCEDVANIVETIMVKHS